VRSIERVTPRVIRVVAEGPELEGFGPPKPGGHIKLFFPDGAYDHKDPEAPRPPSRTYTPRSWDPAARTLAIEFVLHGDGLAANWVQGAHEGDDLLIGGPGGGYEVPTDAKSLVIVADDTAMPGAGTVLEALPAGCKARALCEVVDAKEERPLSSRASAEVTWLHLGTTHQAGSLLEQRVRDLQTDGETYWWVACEAGAMRRIRTHLLKDRSLDPKRVHTRGYWRLGDTNYPDHDYGAD
jgi:NADPH-dependent ferric siderophore reductase